MCILACLGADVNVCTRKIGYSLDVSSSVIVEKAYASVRTTDGRTGTNISGNALEHVLDDARARYARHILDELVDEA
jgi:hypothetical protein